MKKLIVLLLLFLSLPLFAQKTERILNIEECVKLALNINQDVLIAKEAVFFAEQRVSEARALYYPTLDLNFNLSRFSNDVSTLINSNYLPATILLPEGNRDYFYSTKIALWQSIYNGGKTVATNRLAKIQYEKAQTNSEIKKNEVTAQVKTQFYKNIALKEKIDIYKKYLEKNKNETLQNQLDILKHQYELETLELLSLIGLELDTVIDIEGEIKIEKLNLNLQQCILWAYQFRPEIKTTQYQESIDNIGVNLINMEKLPTVMFGASYDWLGDDMDHWERDWYISLNVNVPLFEGGAMFARLKQKKIKARQTTIERAKMEDKIKLEVRKAFSEYNFWYNKLIKTEEIKSNNVDNDILKADIKYNYVKSLIELWKVIGKK
ncbi:TolC family protein [Candidatus Ruminimicrobium bovinum]|uniref:TolC family protein n=1 Tax=Candidatus Ruminimicrobium bovinum TaxID=3242779 RepID=UPI0039B9BA8A